MLQNATNSSSNSSSGSGRSGGNNKSNEGEDGGTDGSNGGASVGGIDGGGDCGDSGGGGGGCGGGGAFQPVKPRSMGNSSPVALCVESTTKTDESVVVARRYIDEMAVDSSTPTTTTTERRKKSLIKTEENAGMSQASIAERYSIAKSNVCRILQRKHEYLRAYEWAGFAGSRKRKLRGDPQQHHHHQQSRGSTRDFNNFQTLKMTNTTNCTISHNHPTNYVEMATSSSTEQATDDNHPIVLQRPTTIIQRGNIICIYFNICLRYPCN
ncbi:CENP-B N-terminal DNA-binding domain-containing protein [Loa loa]|uniref:CENP-B N-terminal DNA-binding domain-containing protein n=1 Tax=Loa loa TaxID=7209 RepID=A0A1S0U342_LOALO|nr:CENP-B N-terminal DNA-binding domain-containing protein [Loa loa]EFO24493.1 CENP-B N-terminal DNA-binding domain-containing protein [Loa loa]